MDYAYIEAEKAPSHAGLEALSRIYINFTLPENSHMQTNEVPQDPKDFKGGEKIRKLMYAVDKDGKYTGVNSAGWEAENFALRQAWEDVDTTLAETEEKVKAGELSPVAYFMQKTLMDTALLAKYVGKWEWQVKRHMKPSVFKTLSPGMLQKYAAVFNITVEELAGFGR